ncbi:hypothetical protein MSPP1_002764 [Malassezia sp. CBS 17886]|nr:hypothetical protein MSPP1_002764 [Malassezia sp. CBS 17886]
MVTAEEWDRQLGRIPVSKRDLDRLVMDFFMVEGYQEAAEALRRESGLCTHLDLDSMRFRMAIRDALHRGDVVAAMEQVNELNPEILDTSPLLFFRLQQLRMIELLRSGELDEALAFASEALAPLAEEHPDLLSELETTMSLVLFDMPGAASCSSGAASLNAPACVPPPPQVAQLHGLSHRQRVACELNSAILTAEGHNSVARLPQLFRMFMYGEQLLSANGPGRENFPRLSLDASKPPPTPPGGDAGTDMVMT